ncbi:MAG: DALR anticodon-binding domain-containing protein [Brevibacterium sp.]
MTPELLHAALERASATARAAQGSAPAPHPDFFVRRPDSHEHGDWTTNLALCDATGDPRRYAAEIAARIRTEPGVAAAEVAGPGFINITLTTAGRSRAALEIVDLGEGFLSGQAMSDAAEGVRRIQLAHVAAHRAHRRATAAGIDPTDFDADTLVHVTEVVLLNALAQARNGLPRALDSGDGSSFLATLSAVVEAFEDWIAVCVVTPTIDVEIARVHASRLLLVRAAITVLAAGLRQLGASAPERM